MSDISQRMAGLSAEKQQLLLQRLQEHQQARFPTNLPLPQVVPRPEERYLPFPLTDVQQTYWTGCSGFFDLGTCGSNVYTEVEITGASELSLPKLHRAVRRLIERHDMLRVIVLPDGQQRILPHVPAYPMQVRDLRGQDAQAVETELESVRTRMCREKGAIDRWPLYDFLIHLLDGQRLRFHARIDALLIDGRSRLIFFQELERLLDDPEAPLPPLECSYRDYALTWLAFQESALYQRSRRYWISRLSTLPPGPELPVMRAISPSTRSPFVTRTLTLLRTHDWQRLKNHAARSGLTPSLLVTAAFAEVIGAWSRNAHFTLSLVGSYRPPIHPQIEHILGNFNVIYLLEVRRMAGSFEERARILQKQLLLDLEHRYFSGFQVLREFHRIQGGGSRAAMPVLFNSVLEYSHTSYQHTQNQDGESGAMPSSQRMEELDSSLNIPQILLSLTIGESDEGGLRCKSQAVEAVFPRGMIPDMLDAYAHLLQTLVDEEASWHNVERELLPAPQVQQRAAFNASEGPVSAELLHTLCAAQLPGRPHQVAVVSPNRVLTYQELYRSAKRVGHWLRRAGAGPGTLVAVVTEKGWEQVVAVLGVLQSGAAYLPVDAGLSREQLWSLLKQGAATLVLTQSWLDESLEWPVNVERLCIDIEDQLEDMDDHLLAPVQTSEDLAYVMYDRDATIREVMITHGGALNTLLALNQHVPIGAKDRVLALSPLHSDLSVYDIFGTLLAGGTLITAGTFHPASLATVIVQEQITVLNSTPAVLELLVDYASDHPDISLASLRLVLLSRDWIPVTLPGRLQALAKQVQVVSLGGVSEASLWSTLYPITAVSPSWKSIPYGRPLTNQRVYVLNEEQKSCPLWVPGEIYIAGRGLAREGWREEEHARARFIQHPETGERLLRTGDLGRFLPDGYLEFLGRMETAQVRAHGYPVERRHIEAVLERHPALRGAIVLEQGHGPGHPSLVAYLLTHQQEDLPALAIRLYLQRHMPEYMIPDAFVLLTAFPLTSRGKVDRGALPLPVDRQVQTTQDGILPRDAVERRIAELWQEILGCSMPGVNENFFDLGGNSLFAVRLINHMRRLFKQDFPVAPFFQGQATIAQLATILRQLAHAG